VSCDADCLESASFCPSLPTDSILLWDDCTVGAWFLHDPSIALGPDGASRVAYQARDISGGSSQPDPTKPRCVAGTDMTWSRLAVVSFALALARPL
jgi:hypothetical protein